MGRGTLAAWIPSCSCTLRLQRSRSAVPCHHQVAPLSQGLSSLCQEGTGDTALGQCRANTTARAACYLLCASRQLLCLSEPLPMFLIGDLTVVKCGEGVTV